MAAVNGTEWTGEKMGGLERGIELRYGYWDFSGLMFFS